MRDVLVRLWANSLLAGLYAAGLGLGAMFFLAVQRLCGANWHTSFRSVPATLFGFAPAAGALLLVVLAGRVIVLPDSFAHADVCCTHWMSYPFFLTRAVVCLAAWIFFARLFAHHDHMRGSVAFLFIAALTIWFASSDWLVSLTPEWSSTIFGFYVFAGFVCSALAAAMLACVVVRKGVSEQGALSTGQKRDLGSWLLGCCSVWAYFWFCQYMLTWYTNQPRETEYFVARLEHGWAVAFYGTVFFKWCVPFLLLLTRAGKESTPVLVAAASSVLLGQWLDLYSIILPSLAPLESSPGIAELLGIAALGLTISYGARTVGRLHARVSK